MPDKIYGDIEVFGVVTVGSRTGAVSGESYTLPYNKGGVGSVLGIVNGISGSLPQWVDPTQSPFNLVTSSELSPYTTLVTTATISGNLQTQINNISGSYTLISTTAQVTGNVVSMLEGGTVNCDMTNHIYAISHKTLFNVSDAFPIVSLSTPTSASIVYSQCVTNRTNSSFLVVLSDIPDTTGFQLNWILFKPYSTATP